jgi:cullin-associated NEDD8-dissociated protein 1
LTLLLEQAPSVTFPIVEKELLSDVYKTAHSSLISGTALDNLMSFFGALVKADNQIATRLVPNLVLSVEKAPNKAENNSANVARCIGYIVQNAQSIAAGTIAEYSKNIKVRRPILL